jgi:hypothetical protein
MSTVLTDSRARRAFTCPNLSQWSLSEAEADGVSQASLADHARELRIRALGRLLESSGATPLWRRVCCHAMVVEIRSRSAARVASMEAREGIR